MKDEFDDWLADRARPPAFFDWPFFGCPGLNGGICAILIVLAGVLAAATAAWIRHPTELTITTEHQP